jgi:hypothetical protein
MRSNLGFHVVPEGGSISPRCYSVARTARTHTIERTSAVRSRTQRLGNHLQGGHFGLRVDADLHLDLIWHTLVPLV